MIKIYINGCQNCGTLGRKIKKLKKILDDNGLSYQIIDSRNNQNSREQHAYYLSTSGIGTNVFHPITVEEDGKIIKRIEEWN